MSGRYPLHTGINNWLPNVAVGLPLDEVTLANLMKAHGYETHAIGKVSPPPFPPMVASGVTHDSAHAHLPRPSA